MGVTGVRHRASNSRMVALSITPARCRPAAVLWTVPRMPLSVLLTVFAIVPDLCNLTGGADLLQSLSVDAEEAGGQFLQRLEFLTRDVRLLVLGKAVDEEAVSADLEQDDRPKTAG